MNALMLFAALIVFGASAATAQPGLDQIAVYAGTWQTETEHFATRYSKARKESSTLRNECWRNAGFFACDQFVNGTSSALIIFMYDAKSDTFTTHAIPAEGGDAGNGTLLIKGDLWTYPWDYKDNGSVVHFHVLNTFTAPDTIQYRQEFSDDNVHWTLMAQGTEKKIAGP